VAVAVQTVIAVTIALAVGLPLGPYNLFNMLGTTGTFVYIPIFILMNFAAWNYFRRHQRQEFSVIKHVVFPVVSTAALVIIGWKSIVPLPAWPVWLAPVIAAGYLAAGLSVLASRLRPGRREWMSRAGELPDVS
jgi:amino acid transporter